MAETGDIYDRGGALPEGYAWDAKGLALAKAARAGQLACRVVAVALIVAMTVWYATHDDAFTGVLPFLTLLFSSLVLYFGLAASFSLAVHRALWKASPRARHDYSLWLYRHAPGRMPKQAANLLLGMARADLEEGRVGEATCALRRIDDSQLGQDELKLFHFLEFVACLNSADAQKSEAQEQLIRYEAVPQKTWEGLPDADVARSWLASESGSDDAVAVLKRVRAPRGIHPVCALLLTLMVSHCLAFAALLCGVDVDGGWKLRCGYANAGSLLASISLLALGTVAAVLAWKRGPRKRRGDAIGTALSVLLCVAMVLISLSLAFVTFVDGALAYDGDERVIASDVEDELTGRRYDYLAVDWQGYDPRDVTTDWWRTDSPFLMEKWRDARIYDEDANERLSEDTTSDASESGTSVSDGDVTTDGDTTSDGDTATSSQDSDLDGTDASLQTLQDGMRSLATYLVDQGIVPQTGMFQIDADAKGNAYASLGTGTDTEGGQAVVVEYRILSNGEKNDADGQPSEEFVLQKWYPQDEGKDPQILGFYLVDESTSAVTDEHRTSW